ncbi:Alpha-D-kanosaminyltransferase [Bacillus sp. THAF10]|uniref:glycosyltransferase family 4 protein n=1 Tax=Bacillus sp. THAF10 TaxID=2587848 RepID=UPI001268D295|nr:glycosyltransferase family 4 protein [Bacillus sp. THAF10]QFT90337.1 Alpha-D-kanosaminyltransferase [Bacillus sp. THAF10]
MLNILCVTDKLMVGGAENYFCKLENHLQHPNATFYFAAADGELYSNIYHREKFTLLQKKQYLQNLMTLSKLVQSKDIHVFHANSLRMVMVGVLVKVLTRKDFCVFYTKHNVTLLEKYVPFLFKKLLHLSIIQRVITVSDFEKLQLIDYGVRSEKIKTIYNGVDLREFQYYKKKQTIPKKIGILARLSKEKNHRFFLEVAKACRHNPNYHFYIAGDGPLRPYIERMIQDLALTKKVTMLGEVKKPQEFIKEMDILLLTSEREVFPMAILEAMAVGTPVVSINKGGIQEAITNGVTGFLTKKHSVEEFLKYVHTLSSNDFQRLQLSKEARKQVEKKFSLEKMIGETVEEYMLFDKQREASPTTNSGKHPPSYRGVE